VFLNERVVRFQSAVCTAFWAICVTSLSCFSQGTEPKEISPDHVKRQQLGLGIFKNHVRQILTEHCLECHGGSSTKADFSLASRALLMESGFLADTAADSHLFELVTHESEPAMPLNRDRLADAEIDWIRQWIDLGAPYDRPLVDSVSREPKPFEVSDKDRAFWSFLPLSKTEIPEVANDQWCRTPIDYFIQHRFEELGLSGNELASRRVLARRASLDLLGLPPSLDEVHSLGETFNDAAWGHYVKQLLNSPHYGERFARHWMDVARFAESHGYEQDYDRPHAYHYRDFLIKAFNQDMPFDQFLRWQIAGDELAPEEPLAMMATGFLGAGVFPTQLTEAEFESARYDELDDMVATTGVTFLGLSVGCARCHDHKFDPISAADYYAMAANFTTTIRSELEIDLDPQQNVLKRQQWADALSQAKADLAIYEAEELQEKYTTWVSQIDVASLESKWQGLEVLSVRSDAGTKYERQTDGSWLATGTAPAQEIITIEGHSGLSEVSQLRLEALTHDSMPRRGPGRAGNGNFALGDFQVFVASRSDEVLSESNDVDELQLSFARAEATHQQNAESLSVASSIDGDKVSGWAVDSGGIGKDQAAVFTLDQPFDNRSNQRWKIVMTFRHPNQKHVMGRFRVAFSQFDNAPVAVGSEGITTEVKNAIVSSKSQGRSNSEAWTLGLNWYKKSLSKWNELSKAIEKLEQDGPPVTLTKVMVSSEGVPHMKHHADGRGYPHFYPQVFFLKRGDVDQKQEVADPGYLQVLTPSGQAVPDWQYRQPSEESSLSFRRSSLTAWMTDVENGAGSIVARVIVNRLWQAHFGQGLVATPNDFGLSGSPPSHPELLDWLACELIENNWSLKHVHQLILTSAVYLQSSDINAEKKQIDPENQWLSRWLPRRAEGEVIRDSMLAVSGQLDTTMYGPGTLDERMKRRSIYFFIKRSKLIPSMMLFDWPEHLVSIGRRSHTTIAPQALSFLNGVQGRVYAKGLLERIESRDPEAVVEDVFQLALLRSPTTEERLVAKAFLTEQKSVYQGETGDQAFEKSCVDLCQMVLSTNEFVYIE